MTSGRTRTGATIGVRLSVVTQTVLSQHSCFAVVGDC